MPILHSVEICGTGALTDCGSGLLGGRGWTELAKESPWFHSYLVPTPPSLTPQSSTSAPLWYAGMCQHTAESGKLNDYHEAHFGRVIHAEW